MAYRVKFLPKARHDLDIIYRRIIQEAPLHGVVWFNGLEQTIYSLHSNAEPAVVAPGLSSAEYVVRQLLYGSYPHIYKIYYQIVGETVEIMHIRHGARRQPKRRDLLR
jgi:plasmid stabilization system protein ParE